MVTPDTARHPRVSTPVLKNGGDVPRYVSYVLNLSPQRTHFLFVIFFLLAERSLEMKNRQPLSYFEVDLKLLKKNCMHLSWNIISINWRAL